MPSYCSSMRNDEKNECLLRSYPFYIKYKQHSLFGSNFGCHLEFRYEESRSRLDTQARKFAYCIIFNIKPSNLFSGGGGTKNILPYWLLHNKLVANTINMLLSTYLWFLRNRLFFLKFTFYLTPATNQIKQFRQKSYKMWRTIQ